MTSDDYENAYVVFGGQREDARFRFTGQQFPEDASVLVGNCDGLCRRHGVETVRVRLGLSWRTAMEYDYCAECLGDFAAGAPIMGGHVYVLATDGFYHEVTGTVRR